jgi:hypothetical protein
LIAEGIAFERLSNMMRLIVVWLLSMAAFISTAHAHGGVGMVDNRCVLKIGPDLMFFTGYQPQSSREEFCDDLPNTGQMVVALDMQDNELRDMLTEIRIIKDDGTHTNVGGLPVLTDAELSNREVLDPVTLVHVEPKKYPTGTLTFEHTFPEVGRFIGVVTVTNDRGQRYVSQFPFSVGQPFVKTFAVYGFIGVLVLAALFGFWRYDRKRAAVSPKSAA